MLFGRVLQGYGHPNVQCPGRCELWVTQCVSAGWIAMRLRFFFHCLLLGPFLGVGQFTAWPIKVKVVYKYKYKYTSMFEKWPCLFLSQ